MVQSRAFVEINIPPAPAGYLLGTTRCSQVLGVGQLSQQAEPSAGGAGIFPFGLFFSRQVVSDSVTPWTEHARLPLSFTISWSLLRLVSLESMMPSNHLILCLPLLLLPSVFPRVKVFPIESVLHIRWTKYWSFSFSISPSKEYSGLISFRMD